MRFTPLQCFLVAALLKIKPTLSQGFISTLNHPVLLPVQNTVRVAPSPLISERRATIFLPLEPTPIIIPNVTEDENSSSAQTPSRAFGNDSSSLQAASVSSPEKRSTIPPLTDLNSTAPTQVKSNDQASQNVTVHNITESTLNAAPSSSEILLSPVVYTDGAATQTKSPIVQSPLSSGLLPTLSNMELQDLIMSLPVLEISDQEDSPGNGVLRSSDEEDDPIIGLLLDRLPVLAPPADTVPPASNLSIVDSQTPVAASTPVIIPIKVQRPRRRPTPVLLHQGPRISGSGDEAALETNAEAVTPTQTPSDDIIVPSLARTQSFQGIVERVIVAEDDWTWDDWNWRQEGDWREAMNKALGYEVPLTEIREETTHAGNHGGFDLDDGVPLISWRMDDVSIAKDRSELENRNDTLVSSDQAEIKSPSIEKHSMPAENQSDADNIRNQILRLIPKNSAETTSSVSSFFDDRDEIVLISHHFGSEEPELTIVHEIGDTRLVDTDLELIIDTEDTASSVVEQVQELSEMSGKPLKEIASDAADESHNLKTEETYADATNLQDSYLASTEHDSRNINTFGEKIEEALNGVQGAFTDSGTGEISSEEKNSAHGAPNEPDSDPHVQSDSDASHASQSFARRSETSDERMTADLQLEQTILAESDIPDFGAESETVGEASVVGEENGNEREVKEGEPEIDLMSVPIDEMLTADPVSNDATSASMIGSLTVDVALENGEISRASEVPETLQQVEDLKSSRANEMEFNLPEGAAGAENFNNAQSAAENITADQTEVSNETELLNGEFRTNLVGEEEGTEETYLGNETSNETSVKDASLNWSDFSAQGSLTLSSPLADTASPAATDGSVLERLREAAASRAVNTEGEQSVLISGS
eukprot:Gregarina_sp_Poly_1__1620@NODE_140_length_13084_cov_215_910194_g125_i0_p2_GENE_NODE_140_length_13084_cov_215_910194_g125_i0NODE_140_length_13084_cov_215_910194_g125_i0_p2_ORF_typecomplete_len881_score143_78_NODE_140_length_13084_cov_215_910194_g125_i069309572